MGTSEEDGAHRWAEMAMERTLAALLLPSCPHFFSSLKLISSSLNRCNSPRTPAFSLRPPICLPWLGHMESTHIQSQPGAADGQFLRSPSQCPDLGMGTNVMASCLRNTPKL